MVEGFLAAQNTGWLALFVEAAPGAILWAALTAILGLLAWISISVVDLKTRVGKLEEGQQQINSRLTRLETRMDDVYARLNDIYKLLAEERLPAKAPPPQR